MNCFRPMVALLLFVLCLPVHAFEDEQEYEFIYTVENKTPYKIKYTNDFGTLFASQTSQTIKEYSVARYKVKKTTGASFMFDDFQKVESFDDLFWPSESKIDGWFLLYPDQPLYITIDENDDGLFITAG